MEIWKDIPNYEGLYKISNQGNIISCRNNQFLKPIIDNYGYCRVALYKNKQKTVYKIHKLVAITFIENPNNYPIINHKDENRTNNCVENLEWCTYKYNNEYNNRHKKYTYKTAEKLGHTIYQYDINHNLINIFPSIIELSRQLNLPRTSVCRHLNNHTPYRGFIFE